MNVAEVATSALPCNVIGVPFGRRFPGARVFNTVQINEVGGLVSRI